MQMNSDANTAVKLPKSLKTPNENMKHTCLAVMHIYRYNIVNQ